MKIEKQINKKYRYILLILFYVSISITAKSQKYSISNVRENTLYRGIENPLSIVVEKMKCGSFIVTTDNGIIDNKGYCNYIIHPAHEGVATIILKRIKNKDTIQIGKERFIVTLLPKPIACIGGVNFIDSTKFIEKSFLRAAGGILAKMVSGFDFDVYFKIISYRVIIVKNNDSAIVMDVKGAKYTEEFLKEFQNIYHPLPRLLLLFHRTRNLINL